MSVNTMSSAAKHRLKALKEIGEIGGLSSTELKMIESAITTVEAGFDPPETWANGEETRIGDSWYYPNRQEANIGDSWYYPNRKEANIGDTWYYPNGEQANIGDHWYYPSGKSAGNEAALLAASLSEVESPKEVARSFSAMRGQSRRFELVRLAWLAQGKPRS